MKNNLLIISLLFILLVDCQYQPTPSLKKTFQSPPDPAMPWVFWYWMRAAVTKEGITADLEAMKEAGIG
ncbi:MAG: hypothetical protein JW798_00585, partial [Prolixibacteraceae bacterium]|nr:hypothetical protein [Prolixibacteraceae bacterium]